MTVQGALKQIVEDFRHGCHEIEANSSEANRLNDHQRELVRAMHDQHGECWLGVIDLYDCACGHHQPQHYRALARTGKLRFVDLELPFVACSQCACRGFAPARVIWKWHQIPLLNFEAAFVLPCYDAELEQLIRERNARPYTGMRPDLERVNAILNRIEKLGGHHLTWN